MSSRFAVLVLLFFIAGPVIFPPFLVKSSSYDNGANGAYTGSTTLGKPYIVLPQAFLVARNTPTGIVKTSVPVIDRGANRFKVTVTAYTSSPEETDDTPFITASGTYVEYGVVAANFLPFGTRVRFPKIFGNQVFIIEDRMHSRFNDRMDVWFPTKEQAYKFGQKYIEVEVL